MAIEQFARDVQAKYGSGKATEHTYRTELEHLMTATGGDNTQAINEPKRSGSNAPDFYISRGVITVGFIEAKDIDKKFDDGQDISKHLKLNKAKRPEQSQKRVNVDFPLWMLNSLDREAKRIGVTRQSIIKLWLAEHLQKSF